MLAAFLLGLTIAPPQRNARGLSINTSMRVKLQHEKVSTYPEIRNQTRAAEQVWKEGKGYLWLQHARKAGGTTLCMTLRANAKGLIQTRPLGATPMERETCQIMSLCTDCDLKTKFPNHQPSLEPIVRNAMQKTGRNMFEAEGFGVPYDILSNRWSEYVFISSIRHPMTRIESSLRNDQDYRQCQQHNDTALSTCLSKYVSSKEVILQRCDNGIYLCHSNYLVRMFSGMERHYTNDADMLERAKRNWHRFSCVVLQEQWFQTSHCLGDRLGLYKHPDGAYNINGVKVLANASTTSNTGRTELLFKEDYQRLLSLNRVDLQFYEWAKDQILQSSNVYNDLLIPKK